MNYRNYFFNFYSNFFFYVVPTIMCSASFFDIAYKANSNISHAPHIKLKIVFYSTLICYNRKVFVDLKLGLNVLTPGTEHSDNV